MGGFGIAFKGLHLEMGCYDALEIPCANEFIAINKKKVRKRNYLKGKFRVLDFQECLLDTN